MKAYLALLAEYLGTFLLTLVILTTTNAFIIGTVLVVIILLIGSISGAVVNPAISFVMYLQSKLTLLEFFYYISVQMLGAASSYGVYRMVA